MDKLKRVFSVFIAITLGSALVLSLAHTHDMIAHASGSVPDWYYDLLNEQCQIYLDTVQTREQLVQPALNEHFNGNLTDSQKRDIATVYQLQRACFNSLDMNYNEVFSTSMTLPSSFTISGYASGALYQSHLDGDTHFVNINPFDMQGLSGSAPVLESDEFTLYINLTTSGTDPFNVESVEYSTGYYTGGVGGHITTYISNSLTAYTSQSGSYFASNQLATVRAPASALYYKPSTSSIPTDCTPNSYSYLTGNMPYIGYLGVSPQIPSADIDPNSPWVYYNETLLPYIATNYPDVPSDVLYFPTGYVPQDPPEPPTYPNNGIYFDSHDLYYYDIDVYGVTDASGQPVTDASGETVTETQIVTETRPTDAVYNFQIPTFAPVATTPVDIPDFAPPADYASYLGSQLSAVSAFLDDSGFGRVVPAFLALGALAVLIGVIL